MKKSQLKQLLQCYRIDVFLVFKLGLLCLLFLHSARSATLTPSPEWADEPRFIPTREHAIGTLTAVAQDELGFMWFGSHYDIHRFDGYKRILFSPNARKENALPGASIKDLLVDGSGKLWIATGYNGLSAYEAETNTFFNFEFNEDDQASLPGNSVLTLAYDRRGGIWVGTTTGLARVDEKTLKVQRYSQSVVGSKEGDSQRQKEHFISALFLDDDPDMMLSPSEVAYTHPLNQGRAGSDDDDFA